MGLRVLRFWILYIGQDLGLRVKGLVLELKVKFKGLG